MCLDASLLLTNARKVMVIKGSNGVLTATKRRVLNALIYDGVLTPDGHKMDGNLEGIERAPIFYTRVREFITKIIFRHAKS